MPDPRPRFLEQNTDDLISAHELPTSPEIAAQGKAEFQKVWDALSPAAQTLFRGRDLRRVFSGVVPEIGMMNFGSSEHAVPPGVLDELEQQFRKYAPEIIVVRHFHARGPAEGDTYFSIVNLRAARRVINRSPEVFPESAISDPQKWLTEHPEEWWSDLPQNDLEGDLPDARYGILSGFPPADAKIFRAYWRARRKLDIPANFDPKALQFLQNYTGDRFALDAGYRQIMSSLLSIIGPTLTPAEKSILIHGCAVAGEVAQMGFLSIQAERDLRYCEKLDQIYLESGIDEVKMRDSAQLKRFLKTIFKP